MANEAKKIEMGTPNYYIMWSVKQACNTAIIVSVIFGTAYVLGCYFSH